jgi:hypothetical protein
VVGLAPFETVLGDTEVFASELTFGPAPGGVLRLSPPPPRPLVFPEPCSAPLVTLGNTKATLSARINPEGRATTYHFELVTDASFQGSGFGSPIRVPANAAEDPTLPGDFELHKVGFEAKNLTPETKYHCRVVAHNAEGDTTGQEGTFETKKGIEFGEVWASEVGTEAAIVNAEVNPLGIPATGYFEYVSDADFQVSGYTQAKKAPENEEINFGALEQFQTGTVQLSGLQSGTLYHYRIVGVNSFFPAGKTEPNAERTLRTYSVPGSFSLPDGRAWEMVSPDQKGSAELGVPSVAGGLYLEEKVPRIQAAAGGGDAVTYTSWTSFGQPQGAPAASQYLSKRTGGGWSTENISPFGFLENPLEPPYLGFAPDLSTAAFVVDQPPLTAEAQDGFRNIYLRNSETGALQALTIEAPQFTSHNEPQGFNRFCTTYGGASADGKRAFFAANGAMAGAPLGLGLSLYEWSAAGGLVLVSVLPNEEPAKPAVASGFGAGSNICWIDQHIVSHAVSEDGSTAFWTYGGKYSAAEHPLFARVNGSETVQLDAKESGAQGPSGEGQFRAATPDGSKAFFSAKGRLTSDSGAAGQIYRYDLDKPQGGRLTNLTPGSVAPEVKGVIGASEDGSYLYFVGGGVLTGGEENSAHQKAEAGKNNLYVWHEGGGLRFIARLSDLDASAWSTAPERLIARLTPDGHSLAFLSVETKALSGYNNLILKGKSCQPNGVGENFEEENAVDPRCAEAYLYDAESGTLTCASCNPSGARPAGPTQLPGWSNAFEGPRFISEHGSRLFFESRDVLSALDMNGKRDVYEFEREGSGSCTAQSSTFSPTSNGCLYLISSGKSESGSYFLDASASGRDVFFSTRQPLVGWDTNENYDVYDAREGGGFPEPPSEPTPCQGEACKPPVTIVPPGPSSATSGFQGPGNVVEKPKKHKKKHKKHKATKKHKPGKGKRRAG